MNLFWFSNEFVLMKLLSCVQLFWRTCLTLWSTNEWGWDCCYFCFDLFWWKVVRMELRSCPPVLAQVHHIQLPDIVINQWKMLKLFLMIKNITFVLICLDEVLTFLMKLDDDLVLWLHRCITSTCLTFWSINPRGWNCTSWSMNEILKYKIKVTNLPIISYHQWKKYWMFV